MVSDGDASATHPEPWEKAADEVLDELAGELGYSGFDGAEMAVERMKERWKMVEGDDAGE